MKKKSDSRLAKIQENENRIPLFKPPYPKVLHLNYIEVVKREFT